MVELQELLEKQNFELVQDKERLAGLVASVAELEEDLGTARKDLIKSEELSSKYQRDLREVRCLCSSRANNPCALNSTGQRQSAGQILTNSASRRSAAGRIFAV